MWFASIASVHMRHIHNSNGGLSGGCAFSRGDDEDTRSDHDLQQPSRNNARGGRRRFINHLGTRNNGTSRPDFREKGTNRYFRVILQPKALGQEDRHGGFFTPVCEPER